MVQSYITTMVTFVNNTRNVHKELKETLTKTSLLMTQFRKIRDARAHEEPPIKLPSANGVSPINENPESMERKMIDAIEELKCAVETQGEEIRALKATKDSSWSEAPKRHAGKPNTDLAPPKHPAWTEVVGKKNTASERTKKPTNMPNLRRRPPAVIMDTSKEDFPALAKKIRKDIKSEVIEDHVVGMRQTKSGGLLFELRGDQEQLELVRAEISRSAGPGITVRELRQEKLLEIRDLDECSTKKNVEEAIALESQVMSGIKVLSIRKKYGGQQTTLASAPIEVLEPILKTGRLWVGMISCRDSQNRRRGVSNVCSSATYLRSAADLIGAAVVGGADSAEIWQQDALR
jgi:hypothetical protein|uniref:Uncharacterized protein n=1 Tax=Sipha flava TaxID=143950 RepID=A0A2S2QK97_9HEMI